MNEKQIREYIKENLYIDLDRSFNHSEGSFLTISLKMKNGDNGELVSRIYLTEDDLKYPENNNYD